MFLIETLCLIAVIFKLFSFFDCQSGFAQFTAQMLLFYTGLFAAPIRCLKHAVLVPFLLRFCLIGCHSDTKYLNSMWVVTLL